MGYGQDVLLVRHDARPPQRLLRDRPPRRLHRAFGRRQDWTKAQDFDFGDKTNTSTTGTYAVEQWTVSGRYVRLAVNASNRNKLYSVSEFVPVLAEKTK
mgnify:CR=1 FL=1